MAFYDRFEKLCREKGVTPTGAARENGLAQSVISMWKTRGSTPQAETVQKLANYFGVSVDYLLGNEQKEKAPTSEGKHEVNDEDLKVALFHGATDVTDEMWNEAKEFARFIYERERKRREGK